MKEISRRISIILLCVICLATLSYTQTTAQYSYKVSETKSLSSVMDDLNAKWDLSFSFPSSKIDQVKIYPGDYAGPDLDAFIMDLFDGTGFTYHIMDGQKVLLRPIEETIPTQREARITVYGTVRDEDNQPLAYIDVVLDTLYKGTTTDEDGRFTLDIPASVKDRNLAFRFLGYETKVFTISAFLENPSVVLSEQTTLLDEVLFVEQIPSIQPSVIFPSSTTAKADFLNGMSVSPFGSDILRSVQMLAGITASDDLSSEIKIRGSQGDETLIVIDGIPIYKSDHFYGIYSAINGNHVNEVSLYKNDMPVSFGGKTGGLLEMSSKDYIQKAGAVADLNMLTSSLTLSAPLGKKAGITLSGRTTYDNAADSKIFNWVAPSFEENVINATIDERPLLLETAPVIQFYDLNTKLYFNPTEDHHINMSFFTSSNKYNNTYDISFTNRLRNDDVQGREAFADSDEWQNLGAAINYRGQLAHNWSINSSLYYSMFDANSNLNTSLELTRNNSSELFSLTNQYSNSVVDLGGNISLSKKLGNDQLTIGISAINHDISFDFTADDNRQFDTAPSESEATFFGTYRWVVDDRWTWNLGGRVNYYSGMDQVYFGPRISSTYRANDQVKIKGSFSKNYQFLREVTHYSRLREPIDVFLLTSDANRGITYPVGTSTTSMIGATYQKNKWAIDFELYNKQMEGVIEHTALVVGFDSDDPKPPARDFEAIIGNGKSIGADLSVGYQSKQYTSWLAYTLSKTTNQFEEIFENEAIPSEDDRRHQLKFTNQYQWGNWSLNGNYVFASGKSQLNLFDLESSLDFKSTLKDDSFSRLAAYHRLDVGIEYSFDVGGTKATAGLSVFNLTNNQNVSYTQYLFAVPRNNVTRDRTVLSGTTSSLLDRTLNLSFKLNW